MISKNLKSPLLANNHTEDKNSLDNISLNGKFLSLIVKSYEPPYSDSEIRYSFSSGPPLRYNFLPLKYKFYLPRYLFLFMRYFFLSQIPFFSGKRGNKEMEKLHLKDGKRHDYKLL